MKKRADAWKRLVILVPLQQPVFLRNARSRRSAASASAASFQFLSSSSSLALPVARRRVTTTRFSTTTTTTTTSRITSYVSVINSSCSDDGDDFHNDIYSPDIPYEILPLTEVIRYLAPPQSHPQPMPPLTFHNIPRHPHDNHINSNDGGGYNNNMKAHQHLSLLPLLSDAQAHQRLLQIGPNVLSSSTQHLSLWEIWWKQFEEDVLAKILACAALVSVASSLSDVWNDSISSGVIVHSLMEPLAIIAILVLNAGVGAWQEISARRSLEALAAMQPRLATLLRRYDDGVEEELDATIITNLPSSNDGHHCNQTNDDPKECDYEVIMSNNQNNPRDHQAPSSAATSTTATAAATARWIPNYDATLLVPGDIIRLRAGNAIPADARLLSLQSSSSSPGSSYSYDSSLLALSSPSSYSSYSSMDVDESSLTGESGSVMKFPGDVSAPTVGSATILQDGKHKNENVNGVIVSGDDGKSSNTTVWGGGGAANSTCKSKNPVLVPIQDQSSMLFSGCLVTRGSGIALVVRTGSDTQIGKIRLATIEAESDGVGRRTPLGEQLQKFGHALSYVIGGICIAIWIASIPHFSDPIFATPFEGAVYYAKVGVALGVAAIPEGLPSAITLCLSLGTRRMAERNAIVRRLDSVETLGCTSVICTDKTGTLTTNQMTAVSFLLVENQDDGDESVGIVEHNITGYSYNPVGYVDGISREETVSHPLGSISDACDIMTLCNDARLFIKEEEKPSTIDTASVAARFAIEGEPTEAALLCLVEKLGPIINNEESGQTLSYLPTLASQNYEYFSRRWDRYATLEFDRKRKSMGVLVAELSASEAKMAVDSERNRRCRLLVKGAPGSLLDRCSHAKLRDGCIIPISSEVRDQIESTIISIGDRALRCIALAVKEGDSLDANLLWNHRQYNEILRDSRKYIDIESGLTFVGLVAIKDPPRPGVSKSIDLCKRAGIRIIMITGDAKATAVAIAKDVHIFSEHKDDATMKAFESREFFAMPHPVQLEILKNDNVVICRAEPADKRRLVKMLQFLGEIPAMTGDGVNDAPALVQASIGIAMGISGTEVAKEASDMVLVDDNFSTIVNAVEEGRSIYMNMQAFINFLITCNIGEVIGVFLASILGYPQLLSPLHLLWVNLATDGPPATALGFNPPDPELMNKKPRPISEELLTPTLLFRYASAGLYIGVATVGIYVSYFLDHGVSLEQLSSWSTCADSASCSIFTDLAAPQTLALTTLVTTELLKALCTVSVNSSVLKVGPHKNPWLLLGVAVPFALNLAVIYLPTFQRNFGLVSLTIEDWVHVLMWSSPIIAIDELQKFASRYHDERKAS